MLILGNLNYINSFLSVKLLILWYKNHKIFEIIFRMSYFHILQVSLDDQIKQVGDEYQINIPTSRFLEYNVVPLIRPLNSVL